MVQFVLENLVPPFSEGYSLCYSLIIQGEKNKGRSIFCLWSHYWQPRSEPFVYRIDKQRIIYYEIIAVWLQKQVIGKNIKKS